MEDTSFTPTNFAAWLTAKQTRPLQVSEAPMPEIKPGRVIIQTKAVSINPVDAGIQTAGIIAKEYPIILGLDGAGIVHAVAKDVTRFKPGDRVIGYTHGDAASGSQRGSFQSYHWADEKNVALLPESISYTNGVVIPSCLGVAAVSLFDSHSLQLDLPPKTGSAKAQGKIVVIWAASSVVGSCAVQLAKAAGYDVFATSSPHNFEYCKKLGAEQVFDYKSPDVIESIVTAIERSGKPSAGGYASFLETHIRCAELVHRLRELRGQHSNRVATVMPEGYGFSIPDGWPEDVKCCFLQTQCEENSWIWREWLPLALEDGRMKCEPEAEIVGKGLGAVQDAIDRWSKGVSAKKIVVEI